MRYVDGSTGTSSPYDSPTAGKYLKSKEGWYNCGPSGSGKSYPCEDTYDFSALPGSFGYSVRVFGGDGTGLWWSASEYNSNNAYRRYMSFSNENVSGSYIDDHSKSNLFSVRCLQD